MKSWHHNKPLSFFILFLFLLTISVFTLSIQAANEKKGLAAQIGQTLYTQFSLFYEKNHHQTTNYRKGLLLPVNSEVKLVKATKKNILVTLPNGQNLTIVNIEAYSGEKIDGIFTRTFATKPVDLSSFTNDEKQAIMSGEVIKGMSKSAVIIALGYPPEHKTPSLQMDQWRYWQNRFDTFVVHFDKEQVTQIED